MESITLSDNNREKELRLSEMYAEGIMQWSTVPIVVSQNTVFGKR